MNTLPRRKPYRLKEYDYSSVGAYFVTICTENRIPCLSEIIVGTSIARPPELHLRPYGKIVEEALLQIPERYSGVFVDHSVIMPNHIHLLLRLTGGDCPRLERIIQQFKGYVTKQCGKSIWQNKYYDHVIRDRNDYLTKAQYILNNPAKWLEDEYYSNA